MTNENITHSPSLGINAHIEALRAAGTKTIKASCGKRIGINTVVETGTQTCPGCAQMNHAIEARIARIGR